MNVFYNLSKINSQFKNCQEKMQTQIQTKTKKKKITIKDFYATYRNNKPITKAMASNGF